jgi:hypothetical protein
VESREEKEVGANFRKTSAEAARWRMMLTAGDLAKQRGLPPRYAFEKKAAEA